MSSGTPKAPHVHAGLPGRPRPPASRWRGRVAGAALVVLTLVAYLPALRAQFIWDDDWHVTNNATLRSVGGLWDIWFSPSRPGHITTPQYYPLTHTTFWVEHHLWGSRPFGYHFDNALLHAVSAVLLWRLLRRLGVPGAWLAAGLWAIHPLNVETVAWVTERKNVLSGLLYLASMTAYLRFVERSGSNRREADGPSATGPWAFVKEPLYVVSFVLFVGALLSKTVASTLPAAVLLILWWKRGRVTWRDVVPLMPFFVVGAVLGLHTSWMERHVVGAAGAEWQISPVARVLIASRAACFYTVKLLAPFALSFNYERWAVDPHVWWQWLYPAAVVFVTGVFVVLAVRGRRGPIVGWLFFLGTLAPALGFFDVYPMRYSFVADHFQYLAGIGVLALCAAVARRVAPKRLRANDRAVATLFVLTLASLTFARCQVFYDSETLWRDALAKNPGSWLAHLNLEKVYAARGEPERALGEARAALALRPDDPSVVSRVAMDLSAVGRVEEARGEHERAVELAPKNPVVRYNFGQDLARWGDLAGAEREFEAALAAENEGTPSGVVANALNNLSVVQLRQNKPAEAEATLGRLVAIAPNDGKARNMLASLLLQRKDLAGGEREARLAVEADPGSAEAHNTLANAYLMESRLDEAIAEYREALRLDPGLGAARRNLEKAVAARQGAGAGGGGG